MNWACIFGFHLGDWIVAADAPVEWVGGIAGARPYQEGTRTCTACGAVHKGLVRAEGPGLIP